tara:strand:- start:123 stop:944 length:822 start_codon:yes stop_codon:yes gene_type:complete
MSTLLFRSPDKQPENEVTEKKGPPTQKEFLTLLKEARNMKKDELKTVFAGKEEQYILLEKYRRQARMAEFVGRVVVFVALATVAVGMMYVHVVNKKQWIIQIQINGKNPTDLYAAKDGSKWGHNYQEGVFMHNDISYTVKREVDSSDASMVGFTIFKTGDDSAKPLSQIKTNVTKTTPSIFSTDTKIPGVDDIKISRVEASKSQGEKETESTITKASPYLILGAVGFAVILNIAGAVIVFVKRREYRTGYTEFEQKVAKEMLVDIREYTRTRK